jgi:hypothetical protein
MRSTLLALSLATVCAAGAAHAQGPAISGMVVDDSTGSPIRGATVTLAPGRFRASSDPDGRFRLAGMAAGEYVIDVQALGYAPVRGSLTVVAEMPGVELRLTAAPIELQEVVVEGVAGRPDRAASGFERRRAQHSGSGRFLGRDELQARQSSTLADIFRAFPGLHVYRNESDGSMYATSGSQQGPRALEAGGGKPCFVQVYVDGIFVSGSGQFDLRGYPPESLEAIEYYRHPSSTPPEFRTGRSPCGVLVMWTRRA